MPATVASAAEQDAVARSQPVRHLLGTFTTQSLAAAGFISFILIAPNLAAETGLPERDFGLALTFIFLGTALSSALTGTYMRWFGSVATQILTIVWMAGVLLIVCVGTWPTTMLAAFLFGLGYGPLSPISMTIVTERTPAKNRGLFLAIRQSSQPLAGAILGRALPPLMLAYGWQTGVITVSATVALGVVLIFCWPALFRLRDERSIRAPVTAAPSGNRGLFATLTRRFSIPANLRVLWFSGIIFAITQVGMVFFSYIYMLEEIKLSPIAAGIFASNLQLAGVFGRPLFGWLCDRLGRTDVVLILIALISIGVAFALLEAETNWSPTAFLCIALACGLSGQAWNAVFTAAMSELVPREKLAEMNGRAFAFLSLGWMSGGPVCWFLIEAFGNYRAMYLTIIVLNITIAVLLTLWALRRNNGKQPPRQASP